MPSAGRPPEKSTSGRVPSVHSIMGVGAPTMLRPLTHKRQERRVPSTTHAARASFLDPRNRHGLRGVGLGRPRERILVAGGLLC